MKKVLGALSATAMVLLMLTFAAPAGAQDGATTDGYVPGDSGTTGTPDHNCGPGPNGYTWYQADCPSIYGGGGGGATTPNCGPGPNGYMWYQEDCPAEYTPGTTPTSYWCGPGPNGHYWTQDKPCAPQYSGGTSGVLALSADGEVLGASSSADAVLTVDASGASQDVVIVDAASGAQVGVSTVAAGSVVAAAKAGAAGSAPAAALARTGASSMGLAQASLALVAIGGMLVLFGRKRETSVLS